MTSENTHPSQHSKCPGVPHTGHASTDWDCPYERTDRKLGDPGPTGITDTPEMQAIISNLSDIAGTVTIHDILELIKRDGENALALAKRILMLVNYTNELAEQVRTIALVNVALTRRVEQLEKNANALPTRYAGISERGQSTHTIE